MPALVVPLNSVGRSDRAAVGGKAAALGELLRAGLPVPFGFAVTCDAYRAHVQRNGLEAKIRERLDAADLSDSASLAAAAAEIRSWVATGTPPPELSWHVLAAHAALGDMAPVAVRSSAVGEDGAEASFAGAHDTFLDVMGPEAVMEKIRDVWASLWTERAVAYRHHLGSDVADTAIAVVVQKMVAAEQAGVLFTADPLTGERDRVVVNAVSGLADALVAGRANSDSWTVAKATGAVLFRRLSGASRPDPPFLPALVALARDAEAQFDAPQDIEWAVVGAAVHVLQSRPITRLPAEPIALADAERPVRAYSDRIREMMPHAMTPFSADLLLEVLMPAIADAAILAGLAPKAIRGAAIATASLHRGRIYIDLTRIRNALLPALDEPTVLDLFETGRRPPANALRLSALARMLPRAVATFPKLFSWMRKLREMETEATEESERLFSPLEREDLRNADRLRLVSILRMRPSPGFYERIVRAALPNFLARSLGTPFLGALERWSVAWGGEPPGSGRRLVSGLTGLVETECAAMLWDLAQSAKAIPGVEAALRREPAAVLSAIEEIPEAKSWRAAFDAFLVRHGGRAIEEAEVANPRWEDNPDYPLSVIARYLDAPDDRDPLRLVDARRAEREKIEARIALRLRGRPIRRRLFSFVLRVAQDSCHASENTKFNAMRFIRVLRRAVLELGRRLSDDGRLEAASDVFFLRLAEIEAPGEADLRVLIAGRRQDLAEWQRDAPPRMMDARGHPVLEGLRRPAVAHGDALLAGVGASPGMARGPVRVIRDPSAGVDLLPGEVLVAPYTDPAWTPLFVHAAAVVVEIGSVLSHASIVARELGLPSVVSAEGATHLLHDGDLVEVDGTTGLITLVTGVKFVT